MGLDDVSARRGIMTRATKRKASVPRASSRDAARGRKTTKASGKGTEKAASGSLAAAKRKADADPFAFDADDMTDAMFGVIVKWVNRGKTTSEWAFQAAVRHARPSRRRTRKP